MKFMSHAVHEGSWCFMVFHSLRVSHAHENVTIAISISPEMISRSMVSQGRVELASDIAQILPLDPESCNQMVEYALLLPDGEVSDHFINMLGESDATAAFLVKFMDFKHQAKAPAPAAASTAAAHRAPKSTQKASHAPQKAAQQPPKAWTEPSQPSQPAPKKPTKPKYTSDLFKEKEAPKDNRKSRKKQLDNLKDLELLLNNLDVTKAEEKDARTVCNCNATRHPLFEIAPNCLNCGKIICAKEGLQPCSFCGTDLLSSKDKKEIRDVLLQEKLDTERKLPPIPEKVASPKPKQKKIVVSMSAGGNLWKEQEAAFKKAEAEKKHQHDMAKEEQQKRKDEEDQEKEFQYYEQTKGVDTDLIAAQERLDKLLDFQDNGEERTKIIDNAADYELTSSNSGNMWLSATERALRLKKQQRQLRKFEESEQKRMGKGKRTVEMVIKDGKVTMVEKFSGVDEDIEDDHIQELEGKIKDKKKKHEQAQATNIWDFDLDQQKWEKPVYAPLKKLEAAEAPVNKNRVQQNKDIDPTQLVVSMY